MMFVRSAAAADLPAVRELLVETWHATYDGIYGADKVTEITDTWHSLSSLKAGLEKLSAEFVVADDGNRIADMAFASASADGRQVMLHQLYIRPPYQGQGAGSLLLDEIVGCFPDAKVVRLEVEPANKQAVAFYRARGFAEVGRTENCGSGQSGIPALILERPLALT
jgi:ribosomal protein S18 acetylase RimI-like enzyme